MALLPRYEPGKVDTKSTVDAKSTQKSRGLLHPPISGGTLPSPTTPGMSPCPERVNKVNCVLRTARQKLQPFTKYPPGNCTCLGLGSDRLSRAQLTALRRTMSKRQQLHCTEPSHPPPLPLLGCSLDNFLPPARLPSPGCAAGIGDSSD